MKIDMSCPKCGKEATEYQANHWQCLKCGVKFIYDPSQPDEPDEKNEIDLVLILIVVAGFAVIGCMVYGIICSDRYSHEERMRKLEIEIAQHQVGQTNIVCDIKEEQWTTRQK
jgi:DNA-directed RNA polymerase subunit RPC12/RpoP